MDDLISRLSEIRSEYNCFDENEEPYYRALSEAIKILSQRADRDTISRQAAIEIIKNYCENGCDYAEDNWCPSCQREKFVELLKALPFAQPFTAYVISDEDGNIKCSNCGSFECWGNYCMDCGAKMRGEV